METLGEIIATKLKRGDVVVLRGELGAGKTALTRGIGRGLGIEGVTSPTFVLSKIYPGQIPLVHVDAYRLLGEELALFDDLDLETMVSSSITVIEWGGGLVERLANPFIDIDIQFRGAPNERFVVIRGIDF
jgi:tRNA threonylcarbamoyladenosine biosynthesis protein TsaE